MAVPLGSHAAHLSQIGRSPEPLRREVNRLRAQFRLDRGVLREEDATAFTVVVMQYIFTVAYRLLHRTFSEADAEEYADKIMCEVGRRVLSRKHLDRWVFGDDHEKGSTYVHEAVLNGIKDVYRKTNKQPPMLSLDDELAVRHESEDGEEGSRLDPQDSGFLAQDKQLMMKTDISERELAIAGSTVAEVAESEGVSKTTAWRRRDACQKKVVKLMLGR